MDYSLDIQEQAITALLGGAPQFNPKCLARDQWRAVLARAAGLGLLPSIAASLTPAWREAMPTEILGGIQEVVTWNTQSHLRRVAFLRDAALRFVSENIDLIVLKGIALAYLAYPSPYSRQMSDVDMLVPQGTLPRVRELMSHSGLTLSEAQQALTDIGSNLRHWPVLQLQSHDGHLRVDIHETIPSLDAFHYDTQGLWARSAPTKLDGIAVRVLRPEDFLAHICLHASHHHGFTSRLLACLDIRLLLQSEFAVGFDWKALEESARAHGSWSWIRLALSVSESVLAYRLPVDLRQESQSGFGDARRHAIRQCFYSGRTPLSTNFMDLLTSPSVTGFLQWKRDTWQAHYGDGPAREKGGAPFAQRARYWRSQIRRLGFLLSREGANPFAWFRAISAARSRRAIYKAVETQRQVEMSEGAS